MKSIIRQDPDRCYICGARATETHHIFAGPNRTNSETYGLTIRLCHWCHNEPPAGIHFDANLDKQIKMVGQTAFERQNPGLSFMEIFGKNYR